MDSYTNGTEIGQNLTGSPWFTMVHHIGGFGPSLKSWGSWGLPVEPGPPGPPSGRIAMAVQHLQHLCQVIQVPHRGLSSWMLEFSRWQD